MRGHLNKCPYMTGVPSSQVLLYSKTCLQGTLRWEDTSDPGTFPAHVKEPVIKGHLLCGDTFSKILECPL